MDLWDLHQEMSIRAVRGSAALSEISADMRHARQAGRVEGLEDRFERLLLLTESMWTLLVEKTGVTEAELLARMTDLDQRDGAVDSRSRRVVPKCTSCGAAVSVEFAKCLYCGAAATIDDAFGRV